MLDFNLFILAACCIQNNNELMQKYKNQNAKGNCVHDIMPSFVVHVRLEAASWLTYRPQAGRHSGRNPC